MSDGLQFVSIDHHPRQYGNEYWQATSNRASLLGTKSPQFQAMQNGPQHSGLEVPAAMDLIEAFEEKQTQVGPGEEMLDEEELSEQALMPLQPKRQRRHRWIIISCVAIVFLLGMAVGYGITWLILKRYHNRFGLLHSRQLTETHPAS